MFFFIILFLYFSCLSLWHLTSVLTDVDDDDDDGDGDGIGDGSRCQC